MLVAAWLPFSILYLEALNGHRPAVATTASSSRAPVASPGQAASASTGPAIQSPAPVTTRVS